MNIAASAAAIVALALTVGAHLLSPPAGDTPSTPPKGWFSLKIRGALVRVRLGSDDGPAPVKSSSVSRALAIAAVAAAVAGIVLAVAAWFRGESLLLVNLALAAGWTAMFLNVTVLLVVAVFLVSHAMFPFVFFGRRRQAHAECGVQPSRPTGRGQ